MTFRQMTDFLLIRRPRQTRTGNLKAALIEILFRGKPVMSAVCVRAYSHLRLGVKIGINVF